MNRIYYVTLLLFCGATSALAQARLPAEGVVFDDFTYNTAEHNNDDPPSGSLFGINEWHTDDSTLTIWSRAWYHFDWDDRLPRWLDSTEAASDYPLQANPSAGTIDFVALPHTVLDSAKQVTTQVMSGFMSRRGSWAARVQFAEFDFVDFVNAIQGFWLYSPTSFVVDDSISWNEVDIENFHSDYAHANPDEERNQVPYIMPGHNHGNGGAANGKSRARQYGKLGAQAWPDGATDVPEVYSWSCKYVWVDDDGDVQSKLLDGERRAYYRSDPLRNYEPCSEVINGTYADPDTPMPIGPAYVILFVQVTDDGVRYEFSAEFDIQGGKVGYLHAGSGDPLVYHPNPPQIPLAALFSVYYYGKGRINYHSERRFKVDWIYHTPATDHAVANINTVQDHVAFLKAQGYGRYVSVPAFRTTHGLAKPDVFASDCHTDNPMDLVLEHNPSVGDPGETIWLSAFPTPRHGRYLITWDRRYAYTDGSWSAWSPVRDKVLWFDYTLPTDASVNKPIARVQFRVTVYEVCQFEDEIVNGHRTGAYAWYTPREAHPHTAYHTVTLRH